MRQEIHLHRLSVSAGKYRDDQQ